MTWEEFAKRVIEEGRQYLVEYPEGLEGRTDDETLEDFGCYIANKYIEASS